MGGGTWFRVEGGVSDKREGGLRGGVRKKEKKQKKGIKKRNGSGRDRGGGEETVVACYLVFLCIGDFGEGGKKMGKWETWSRSTGSGRISKRGEGLLSKELEWTGVGGEEKEKKRKDENRPSQAKESKRPRQKM